MINLTPLELPGADKDTVSERVADRYKLARISTGDVFREAVTNETPVGPEAKSYIGKGNLVPDEVTTKLVEERLAKPDTNNGFILDGFPRTTAQTKILEDVTRRLDKPLTNAIAFDAEENMLVDGLSARFMYKACGVTYNKFSKKLKAEGTCDRCGGREFYQGEDDKPGVVRNRPQVNEKMNAPLHDFYQQEDLLSVVNDEQSPEKIFEDTDAIFSKN